MKIEAYKKAEKIINCKKDIINIIDTIKRMEDITSIYISNGITTNGCDTEYSKVINPNVKNYEDYGKIDIGDFEGEFKRFLKIYKMNLLEEINKLNEKLENIKD